MEPWIQTRSGKRFDLLDPKPEQIDLEDIAHSLSMLCRFNGHTREFYSVAQHSVLVADWMEGHYGRELAKYGLLHDAAEAYIGDMGSPLKSQDCMTSFRFIEYKIMDVIWTKFGIEYPSIDVERKIKKADLVMLATECRDLMQGERGGDWHLVETPKIGVIDPWSYPHYAKVMFLNRAKELGIR